MLIEVAVIGSISFEYVIQTIINAFLGLYYVENFYDCVAKHFASLTYRSFDMSLPEIICCFKAIQ